MMRNNETRYSFALYLRHSPHTEKPMRAALAVAFLAITVPLALVQPAQSRIICDGNYQIVNGSPISTPYCRDLTMVQVARAFGIRVSLDAIRNSESTRRDVCAAIGHDNRVRDTCQPYLQNNGGARFRF
jgi:hypothetical protein